MSRSSRVLRRDLEQALTQRDREKGRLTQDVRATCSPFALAMRSSRSFARSLSLCARASR